MIINLSPCVSSAVLNLVKRGDVLELNGEVFDFSPIGEGDTLPATAISSDWFMRSVDRQQGQLQLTILFPIPEVSSQAQAFPTPLVDVPDGVVVFPEGPPKVAEPVFEVRPIEMDTSELAAESELKEGDQE